MNLALKNHTIIYFLLLQLALHHMKKAHKLYASLQH